MIQKLIMAILVIAFMAACKNSTTTDANNSNTAVETPVVKTHKLIAKWESDSLFKVPESVLFDANNQVLYVSNIEGTEPWGADGKGSIGQLGLDGKIINAEWVKGLQAPKGMGIFNGKLYVADLKEVVTIDIASGKIENRFKVPGAVGLNDISIDATGVIYVTDSQGKRLYRIESNSASIILDSLAGPNGVLVNGSNLYILNAGGFYKISKSGGLGLIADGMEGGTDGVENVQGDEFIVSCWAGAVWYINDDGRKELLYDGKSIGKNTADIGFDPATRTVYVPTFWKNTVMAFEVAEN